MNTCFARHSWSRGVKFCLPLLFLAVILQSCPVAGATAGRKASLDFDWRFHLGDIEGGENPKFNDKQWRLLDVPHDWSIEGEYDKDNATNRQGAFLPAGIGWYRKKLQWDSEWDGKRVILQFDGVYMNSDVWVNGHHVGKRPYGYISFWYDVTRHLRQGENTIAVRVDHSRAPSGRWYTGSGIYRNVWLIVVDPVHIPVWGTYVRTKDVNQVQATVEITTELKNLSDRPREVTLETKILKERSARVVEDSTTVKLSRDGTEKVDQSLHIENPDLWSPETPVLYRAVSTIRSGDQTLDTYETPFGVRDIQFTVDRGFVLNGEPLELQGACLHHDGGPVGAAVPEDVLRRRLQMLKDMGANAVRTAHNPFAPEFYRLTDEIGLMVMDEAFDGWMKAKAKYDYGLYFNEWWQRDLSDFLRRDRNHPSVIMWSIGNEVPGWKPPDQKRLVDFVHELDPTRPVTQGRGYGGPHLDIAGFNGHGEFVNAIEKYHQNRPDLPVIGTEITHSTHTRGIYRTKTKYRTRDNPAPWEMGADGGKKKWEKMKNRVYKVPDLADPEVFPEAHPRYHSSYDNSFVRMSIRDEIRVSKKLPYLLGTFRWTAFDYLGESFGWPARTENFGIIDLAGFPKDNYYLYQSQWSKEPMVHVLPHWTHPCKEGVSVPVVVYTNQPTVELLLNDNSLGKKDLDDQMQLVWQVPYEPGRLEAIATSGGSEVVRKALHTAGSASGIELSVDRTDLLANRRDVAHVEVSIVDQNGVNVPDADHRVDFQVIGPAKLIGVENGDILDLSPTKANYRRAFHGKCLALLQSTDEAGEVTVRASSPELQSATLTLTTRNPVVP